MARPALACLVIGALAIACATPTDRYRLAGSSDVPPTLAEALAAKYPDFLGAALETERAVDLHTRDVRDDLERSPVDARNFDALHAIAVAYFELNARAQADIGGDLYLAHSFRAAKVVAIPWRAYSLIEDASLRDAILDFFEDAAFGSKAGARETAPRLARIVTSLVPKETDATRRARIEALAARIEATAREAADGS